MSHKTTHRLECPHCGNRQKTSVWDSVNVTLNPELKDKLFDADINIFVCERCKEKTFINTPVLYHDMSQRFCVQYYPPEALDNEAFFSQFTPEGRLSIKGISGPFGKSGRYLASPHIVFDMNEMIRYVAFREGLHEMNKK